jgi:hypothetical protein
MARLLVACAAATAAAASHVFTPRVGNTPPWPATWQANASTIVMPCNDSGLFDPVFAAQCAWGRGVAGRGGAGRCPAWRRAWVWVRAVGVVDFDWSNGKQVSGAPAAKLVRPHQRRRR